MDALRSYFRRWYGTGPGHLLLMLGCFAFAGYVASLIDTVPQAWRIGVWFVGAAVFHDLVMWPLYALADRLTGLLPQRRWRTPVPWTNHIRVPTVISGVLLIISFPLVLGMADSYRGATGLSPSPYLDRYLVIVGVLYGTSLALLVLRLGIYRRRHRDARSAGRPAVGPSSQ